MRRSAVFFFFAASLDRKSLEEFLRKQYYDDLVFEHCERETGVPCGLSPSSRVSCVAAVRLCCRCGRVCGKPRRHGCCQAWCLRGPGMVLTRRAGDRSLLKPGFRSEGQEGVPGRHSSVAVDEADSGDAFCTHSRSACSALRGLSGRHEEAQHTLSVGTAPLSFPKPQQLAWVQPWEVEPQAGTCGQRARHDLHVLQ